MSVTPANPLLETRGLPPFSKIQPEHVRPAIEQLIDDGRRTVRALLADLGEGQWDDLLPPLEEMDDRLDHAWSPVSHLHSVADNPELRAAYNACLPLLTDFANEMGQNEKLYRAFEELREADGFTDLDAAKRRVVDNALRDFRLAGVHLSGEQKEQYRDISRRLAELASRFEENVLDATQAWRKHVVDETALAGLPDSALALARQTAEGQGLEGYLLTLEIPSYQPVVTYAEDATLRAEAYQAYVTRASDQGPDVGRWNNAEVMEELLALRHQMAGLLGHPSYAALVLEKRMARSTDEVMSFLTDLAERSRPVAVRELGELQAFARTEFGVDKLQAWDIPFYSEKLRQHKHAISQEELRPYFPLPQVLEGLFAVAERLFSVRIKATDSADTWHPDVRFFDVNDASGTPCGQFFLDPFARPHKRGGAWMDECIVRRRTADGIQRPVAFLTCNFSPPVGKQPSLLTHDEVTTLFHEFGHGLHHLLTRVEWRSVSGINGVPWDAVELPSQLMENWCWERQALDLISGHWETGETLPDDMFQKLRSAKNFQSGMQMVRQLEFALFDFRLHLEYDPARGARIQEILDDVRRQVAVLMPPAFNRLQHSFSHIFAGGYAAGYYSYKWAEVLSSDVYSAFEERGVFDHDTGRRFLDTVLRQGGSRDAMALFVDFRGREPEIDALLRHNGINGDNAIPGGSSA